MCHGCFDIVHPGHVRYLEFARRQGDLLLVTLTGDSHVGKGPDRPYVPEDLRAENLAALLAEVRIEADTEFIMKPEGKTVADVIHEQSAGADVVFLGLRDPEAGKEEAYARRMAELTEGLNTTIFVHSSGRFAGKLI